ncbi:unnamed protein product [Prorocentrum cordatum]|uniref:Uncharacterized protein n=1 Tax=Prorocentrum cordatum TaxID=2364126 RepID=A0ABN9T0U5_9DINO|nr:unnamed protein product [Polarella glacialis]
MSCGAAADVGGHYCSSTLSIEPWSEVVYVSDSSGMSSSSTTANTGVMLLELAGRTFVVHELDRGARIACGVLVAVEMAIVGAGDLAAAGTVTMASSGVASQVLTWDLTGLDTDCAAGAGDGVSDGCGIHVRTWSTCDVAADVGGHFYSSALDSDPWADFVYLADRLGASTGAAEVATGLALASQVGRAFIACGIVGEEMAMTTDMCTTMTMSTTIEMSTTTTMEMSAAEMSTATEMSTKSLRRNALWHRLHLPYWLEPFLEHLPRPLADAILTCLPSRVQPDKWTPPEADKMMFWHMPLQFAGPVTAKLVPRRARQAHAGVEWACSRRGLGGRALLLICAPILCALLPAGPSAPGCFVSPRPPRAAVGPQPGPVGQRHAAAGPRDPRPSQHPPRGPAAAALAALLLAAAAAAPWPALAAAADTMSEEEALLPWVKVVPYYGTILYLIGLISLRVAYEYYNYVYIVSAILLLGPPVIINFSYKWGLFGF